MGRAFDTLHPWVSFIFFAVCIVFSMISSSPVMLAVSFASALILLCVVSGAKALRYLLFSVPAIIAAAAVNTAFNHEGATVLLYINGNPITLESVIYGAVSGTVLMTVIIWFACFSRIMTSEKIMFLFAKVSPSLSLLFSMILRFVPQVAAKARQINEAQRLSYGTPASLYGKIKRGLTVIYALLLRSFEDAADTADSMKCRGYGLPGRTAFSRFRFTLLDGAVLAVMLVLTAAAAAAAGTGAVRSAYFPLFSGIKTGPYAVITYTLYAALLNIPAALCVTEEIKWSYLKSRI